MNTIVQEINWPLRARQRHIPFFTLPLYVRVVLGIVMGFSAVSVSALALGGLGVPPQNPFTAYADIFPGQPESAIDEQVFSCYSMEGNYYSFPAETSCRIIPAIGTFSAVNVMISNHYIQQTTFIVRDNTLRVGDLALFFGTNDFRMVHSAIFFSWNGNFGNTSTISNTEHFSMFRFVWQVALSDTIYPPVSERRVDA